MRSASPSPSPPTRATHRGSARLAGAAAALLLAACARGGAPVGGRDDPSPARYDVAARELTADQQVAHAISRLTFGARAGDVARVRARGVDRWIDEQLRPERIDDAAAERFASASYPTLALRPAELLRSYPPRNLLLAQLRMRADSGRVPTREDSMRVLEQRRRANAVVGQLASAKVARAVLSERQLQEVMTDFWENHFSVFIGKGQIRYFLPEYDRDVIRPRALGRFRDLLGAAAKSPAMLFYLDNAQSVADSSHPTLAGPQRVGAQRRRQRGLNENYARELMELHTLGVDGGYTQQDVIEVARALTGWTIRPPRQGEEGGAFVFRPEMHDAGEKVVLGHRLPAGRGMEDGEAVLDLLARHPSTARFIARKLCVRFVSDSAPPTLVERAAETFRRTDGDIRETLRTIVHSPEFFSVAAYRAKVKSPFEVVASALRAVGAAPDSTPRTAQLVARLGQPVFGHQAPNGWPETGDAWMNTGAILSRINFGLALAAGRVPGAELRRWPPLDSLRALPRDRQIDGVIAAILGGAASSDTRAVLHSGRNPLLADAGSDSTRSGDALRAASPASGIEQLVGLALGAPEFQRR